MTGPTEPKGRPRILYAWGFAGVAALLRAVYGRWVAVASPIGEFTLNDDWAYAHSRHLLETGRFKLSNWTSASGLFQVYLGFENPTHLCTGKSRR